MTFNAGSATVVMTFAVVDDTAVEAVESVTFTLSAGAGYTRRVAVGGVRATIADNDAPPALPVVSVTATNGAEGGAAVVVTVSRSGSTLRVVDGESDRERRDVGSDWLADRDRR